jgi:hypothetical protein
MKAQIQLFVKEYGTNDWSLLDLYDTDPLKMNLRVQNVTDPTVAVASYSQTFRVPHSYVNGKFFEQAFNVNQTLFDPSKKAQAYINNEGQLWMNGNIQLLNVYRVDSSSRVEYEIVFMNETSDFATQIGLGDKDGGFLTDLNFNDLVHAKDRQTIINSWTGNLFNYQVLYPLIEWGYNYTGSGASTVPDIPTLSTDGVKTFTSSANPLLTGQLKPALQVKTIWDRIFANTDYTYESDFINSEKFKKLYVVADKEARTVINQTIGFKGNFEGTDIINYYGGGFNGPNATPIHLRIAGNPLYDYGANYVSGFSNEYFLINTAGNYTFNIQASWIWLGSGAPTGGSLFIFYLRQRGAGNTIGFPVNYYFPSGNNSGTIDITTGSFFFNQGQQLEFMIQGVGIPSGSNIMINNVTISTDDAPGDQVNPSSCLPANIKQIDFVRSIVERFKLVFEPDQQNEKNFFIEPWSEWIRGGIVRDWTYKLNEKKDYKLNPLFQTQQRFVTFRDQEDSDYLNYNYQQSWKQTFGQLNLDSFIEVIKGTKTVQGIFAPLPIGPIGYGATASNDDIQKANKFLIPHIAKDEVTKDGPGKRTPIQPKLRLGFYNGMTGAPKSWYFVTTSPVTEYPLMSSYYPDPWTNDNESLDWSWSPPQFITPDEDPTYSTNPDGRAKSYAFDNYWQKWYYSCYGETNPQSLDKDFSYLFEGEFILDYKDLLDLRYNDKIFIKDAYYLVNYINDYIPGQKSPCKVQLYKLNNIGIQLPNVFLPITDICYNASSLCDAVCCKFNSPITTVYSNTPQASLAVGSVLFLNASATVYAPNGYYSDGVKVYTVTGGIGVISAIDTIDVSPALCTCVPVLNSKNLCYAGGTGTFCDACCCQDTNVTVWLEDNGPNWYLNTFFYSSNIGGTAANGWYSDGTRYVYIENGLPGSTGLCNATCNCDIYDLTPYSGCTGAIECDAVCCVNQTNANWYANDPLLADATFLYLDQALTPVSNGWYYDGISVVQVTGGTGAVTAVGDPENCIPCPNETLDVYFDLTSNATGAGFAYIEKSINTVNWIPITTVDFATAYTTPNTTYNYTGSIAPNTFVRTTVNYQANHGPSGTFTTTVEQTGVPLNSQNTVRFGYYTFTPSAPSVTGTEYRFSLNLTGSNLDCGLTGGTAIKCVAPSCTVDVTNSVYYIDNDITICCDPWYITDTGFSYVNQSEAFVNGNCTGPTGTCYECGDNLTDSYAGSDYHQYEPYSICDGLVGTSLNINWFSIERPNRFNIYSDAGLLNTSGWVGYANYPGPWGLSLSTPSSGTLSAPYVTGNNTYILVEAGPADPSNPISDSWDMTINCQDTCYNYVNASGFNWLGDYQSCDGTWYYAATVTPGGLVCAKYLSPFTISGMDLVQSSQCNI